MLDSLMIFLMIALFYSKQDNVSLLLEVEEEVRELPFMHYWEFFNPNIFQVIFLSIEPRSIKIASLENPLLSLFIFWKQNLFLWWGIVWVKQLKAELHVDKMMKFSSH